MSLAETRSEYDDAGARKALAKAIKAHQAKAAELADMRAAIEQAEAKLAAMQEAIDKSAHVEDAIAEAAAEALRLGTEISERSDAWRAKQQRDELIAEPCYARLRRRAFRRGRETAEIINPNSTPFAHRFRAPASNLETPACRGRPPFARAY